MHKMEEHVSTVTIKEQFGSEKRHLEIWRCERGAYHVAEWNDFHNQYQSVPPHDPRSGRWIAGPNGLDYVSPCRSRSSVYRTRSLWLEENT